MKFLFRKRKGDKEQQTPETKKPGWVGQRLNRFQVKSADWMTRKTAGISRRGWGLILASFITASIACNGLILMDLWVSPDRFTMDSIKIPDLIEGLEGTENQKVLPGAEIDRIELFQLYLDSLLSLPERRDTYDSILRARPGLLDSIGMVEKEYNQQ